MTAYVVGKEQLVDFLKTVKASGYEVIAPRLEDGVIRLGQLDSEDELATGVTTVQDAGRYSTESSDLTFSFTHGPDSPKRFLYPPLRKLWRLSRKDGEFELLELGCDGGKIAFFGIKPCDLASIEVLDRTLMRGKYADELYVNLRRSAAIIVANCIEPSGTCFCASMGTGPRAKSGFDVALTELSKGFLVEVGTKVGQDLLASLGKRKAEQRDIREAEEKLKASEHKMGVYSIPGLRDKLYAQLESPAFKEIAKRCLGCANCTSVCPTCFCTMIQDVPNLDGKTSDRTISWDSCFTYQFAQVAGGHFRPDLWARYRQWIVHKFAYWLDQFDTFGCIGCGRCITWCPVAIDVTKSVMDVTKSVWETQVVKER